MIRNKMILTAFAVVMAIILATCADTDTVAPTGLEKIPITTGNIEVKLLLGGDFMYDADTVEELEKLSGYIVKGRLLDDAKQKLDRHEKELVYYGVTVSTLDISKVYKGKLHKGDKIHIEENYFALEENGKVIRYERGYAPSNPNVDYIFFLNKEDGKTEFHRGLYSPALREKSRYAVIDKNAGKNSNVDFMTAEDLNIIEADLNSYKELYKQVIGKYMNWTF